MYIDKPSKLPNWRKGEKAQKSHLMRAANGRAASKESKNYKGVTLPHLSFMDKKEDE